MPDQLGRDVVLRGEHHIRLPEVKRSGGHFRIAQTMRSTIPSGRKMPDEMKIEDRRLAIAYDRSVITLLGRQHHRSRHR
jgi:hypothetical protein